MILNGKGSSNWLCQHGCSLASLLSSRLIQCFCSWYLSVCSVEGVFYRIRQKLDKYRLEPVAGLINDHISNSKVSHSIGLNYVVLFQCGMWY